MTAIISSKFIQRLLKDMKKYNILYICAPFGWEKEAILKAVSEELESKEICWLEYKKDHDLAQQIAQIPNMKKTIYMIPNMELIVEHGQQDLIWELMENKKSADVFVVASTALLPAKMLPYTILNRYISYGIEDVRPSNEDISSYMKHRGILLTNEELLKIEKDSNHMPLYIYLLSNLMAGAKHGYNRAVREQCFEDLFSYIDVAFFRSFEEKDQNAMLKLSCMEEFDDKLISYMLDNSRKEVDDFVKRILTKGSVFEKSKNGWKFQPVMKLFLERAIQKYFDYEERLEDYRKAMEYLISKEKWFPALRFTYILQSKEQMAVCLDNFLQENVNYNEFVTLEKYFRELPADILMNYPGLMIAGSILKAVVGDKRASRRYENQYLQLMNQVEDENIRKSMQAQLLFLYMSRPGMMRGDGLEIGAEILDILENDETLEENRKFEPQYISVLRGEKDYCQYFKKNHDETILKRLHKVTEKTSDSRFALMLRFMEAEVLYEKNDLDRALDSLVKITRESKFARNERMQQLCTLAMVDLLAVRNQMNPTETFQLERLETEEGENSLFYINCQAHMIYYHLLKNNTEAVLDWMKTSAPDEQQNFFIIQYYQYLIKAKVYIWMEQYVRARMLLQILMDFAVEYKMAYLEAQVRLLEAVIYYREDSTRWKETLIPALEWGRELSFVRVFADEGAAVYELLHRMAQEDKEWAKDEYFKKVLSAAKAQMLQYPKYLKQESQSEVGQFSNSEKSVMSLLVLGEKNAEIANQLCVSENTVKYHLKNIYQKLQVKSRSQAIHKIREYDIL